MGAQHPLVVTHLEDDALAAAHGHLTGDALAADPVDPQHGSFDLVADPRGLGSRVCSISNPEDRVEQMAPEARLSVRVPRDRDAGVVREVDPVANQGAQRLSSPGPGLLTVRCVGRGVSCALDSACSLAAPPGPCGVGAAGALPGVPAPPAPAPAMAALSMVATARAIRVRSVFTSPHSCVVGHGVGHQPTNIAVRERPTSTACSSWNGLWIPE